MPEDELRKLDYEKTVAYIDQLSDIRFKLLALIPLATGAALTLAEPGTRPATGAVLGLLGFFVTLGIVFYEQRNTEIYEKQVRRAKLLEIRLGMPPVSARDGFGGPFMGRAARERKLFGWVEMWHDRALALIYGMALGGWAYLSTASVLGLFPVAVGAPEAAGGAAALVVVALTWQQFYRLDKHKSGDLAALDGEIQEMVSAATEARRAS